MDLSGTSLREKFFDFMSITEDNNRDLWMATYGGGVWRYDGKNLTHHSVKDGDKDVTLFSIYKDNKGDLWLGTHEAGAYKFNGKTFEKLLKPKKDQPARSGEVEAPKEALKDNPLDNLGRVPPMHPRGVDPRAGESRSPLHADCGQFDLDHAAGDHSHHSGGSRREHLVRHVRRPDSLRRQILYELLRGSGPGEDAQSFRSWKLAPAHFGSAPSPAAHRALTESRSRSSRPKTAWPTTTLFGSSRTATPTSGSPPVPASVGTTAKR